VACVDIENVNTLFYCEMLLFIRSNSDWDSPDIKVAEWEAVKCMMAAQDVSDIPVYLTAFIDHVWMRAVSIPEAFAWSKFRNPLLARTIYRSCCNTHDRDRKLCHENEMGATWHIITLVNDDMYMERNLMISSFNTYQYIVNLQKYWLQNLHQNAALL
jgi:hypothetical protein